MPLQRYLACNYVEVGGLDERMVRWCAMCKVGVREVGSRYRCEVWRTLMTDSSGSGWGCLVRNAPKNITM